MRFLAIARAVVCAGFFGIAAGSLDAAPEKWAADIERFADADAVEPPPRDAVLFIGSSSIARWKTLPDDFPDVPVINRGFGGSELSDCVYYLDRVVLPYRPRIVVLYAGENDLFHGKTPESITADFKEFCRRIHTALPETRVICIGLKPSRFLWRLREEIVRTNALLSLECAQDKRRAFVDIHRPMLNACDEPRGELYAADMLHMSAAGYAIWRSLVAPLLKP